MLELPEKRFRLLNVKTGELFELECSMEPLTNIVIEILKGRYHIAPLSAHTLSNHITGIQLKKGIAANKIL